MKGAKIDFNSDLLNFRHLLEKHDLSAALFAIVGELLQQNGLKLSGDIIVRRDDTGQQRCQYRHAAKPS